ncbi:MAG TPA: MBL fold metallo-hydrolase [Gemmatimonadales bacterium]|jgi:glyoxylase-like metal-dependent hydrolase (beta-lactamase superfamily II)/rhodanese-related sulfurtransferase
MHHATVPEIDPAELARQLEHGDAVQVLDIRAPGSVAAGRIELASDGLFHNIVGSRLATVRSADDLGLDRGVPVAVVCAHGNSSLPAAAFLRQLGLDAKSLRGGMAAWMQLCLQRELPAPPSVDALIQLDRIGKGALGYVLVSDGAALVVDAPRDWSAYRAAAEAAGARIVGVADTHCHADYISGGPALAGALGVPYYLHPADAVYPYDGTPGRLRFEPLDPARTLPVGRARVHVLHTPGHTEGSVTFTVDDAVALTGDFVFVASVGRPDLAGRAEEWTTTLWNSLESARASWNDDMLICPAHYASERERNVNGAVCARFGDIRASNQGLEPNDHEQFAAWVRKHTATFPDSYRAIKAVNVGLLTVDDFEAEVLETGKNECAVA